MQGDPVSKATATTPTPQQANKTLPPQNNTKSRTKMSNFTSLILALAKFLGEPPSLEHLAYSGCHCPPCFHQAALNDAT